MTYVILSCSEHFTELAFNEIRRSHPETHLLKQLSPQNLLLRAEGSFDNFSRPWRNHLPIYLHHLFPVHQQISLKARPNDLDLLQRHAQAMVKDDYQPQVRIIGKSPYQAYEIEALLMPPKPNPARVLSILIADKIAYMGLSWANQNLLPCPNPQFPETVPNRAGLKLLEALDTFEIRLRPNDYALDLGAAPGAWSEIILRHGLYVTAVAPTEMYPWLQTNERLRHFQTTAEEYLQQCDTGFDLLLNDMKLDAQDSARLMLDYAKHLRSEGIAIMTFKLNMRNPSRVIDHAMRILRKEYKIIRLRQLLSNRKEITLFLRRKT